VTFNEFYLLPENLIFTVAVTVVTIMSLLEGVLLFFGAGLINFFDVMLPDIDLELDGFGLEDKGFVSKTLSFLKVKDVPLVILFVCFLMSFGLSGLFLQAFCLKVFGTTASPYLVTPFALFIGLTLMRGFGVVISKLIPRDETDAVKINELIGRIGTITLGDVSKEKPAQCKVKDKSGQIHYFMSLPDNDNDEIKMGEKVLFVRYESPYFFVIRPENKNI